MIQLHTISRITVYASEALSNNLIVRFVELGAKGYTIVESRGKGDHGTVEDLFAHSSHVRIEVLVQPAVADRIMEYLASPVLRNQSVAATLDEVSVIDPKHF
jgi:hypothetical protein